MQQKAAAIIGYYLGVHEDGSHMLGPDTYRVPAAAGFHDWRFGADVVPHPATCRTCGRKVDPAYVNPAFRVRRRTWDISATYDGYTLVSKRFRVLCERHRWSGVEFAALPADPDFFVLRVAPVVAFDAERRQTRFEQHCPTCDAFYAVVGATPVFLKNVTEPLRGGFFRTDLEFACGPEQHPLTIVGIDVAQVLRDTAFREFYLKPIAP
jgi:hypothetical protein